MTVIHEIPFLRDAEVPHRHVEFLRRQQLRQLLVGPAIEFSLMALALSLKGQIVLPSAVREQMHLELRQDFGVKLINPFIA